MTDSSSKKYAILSVSNKDQIENFAQRLFASGYRILATGNTAKAIKNSGIECIEISDFTGFPEIFSGRVKTLQPSIFGGILMRRDNEEDKFQAEENNIPQIDIVCVNLYPFPDVVKNKNAELSQKIENIDIGGPSLIRAAAKNYKFVSVLTNPSQYKDFLNELESGGVSLDTRIKLASTAFSYTSFYDTVIANFFEEEFNLDKSAIRLNYPMVNKLRYGENPHQKAYLFGNMSEYFEILHGREISYNNIIDLAAAVDLVNELPPYSCAIIKHTNPCGAANGRTTLDSYKKALSCDPVSAFGGIVAFNSKVDTQTANELNELFLEIVAAPDYEEAAIQILQKKKNRRVIKIVKFSEDDRLRIKDIPGGLIGQEPDKSSLNEFEFISVTGRECSADEIEDLKFAWTVCKHTKSNSIVYVKDKKSIGVGAGQMSRIDSAKIAAEKAAANGFSLKGAVAASDAFFPFADGLTVIAENGISAVIQPGGSVRDEEVIAEAKKYNIAMVFTGIRNFKH